MSIHRLARRFAALLLPLFLAACGGGGEDAGGIQRDVAEAAVSCPGADLARMQTVVYVAPDGLEGDSCGATVATACKSIAEGIRRCTRSGCAVAVRYGLYRSSENIALVDGVAVYGSCRFSDEPDLHYRTVIAAAPPAGVAAISASNVSTPTVLSNIVVLGKDETAPGKASVGMLVRASRGLSLSGVTLVAGRGGEGAAGNTAGIAGSGGDGTQPGPNDFFGGNGGASCPAKPQPWPGNGGRGRDMHTFTFKGCPPGPDCDCTADPPPADLSVFNGQASGSAPGGANGGVGGVGRQCRAFNSTDPTSGADGTPGELGDCSHTAGTPAAAPAGLARFAKGRWRPSTGNPGVEGGTGGGGGGGGGGGAGGYALYYNIFDGTTQSYPGLPGGGGGGGGGGCGGAGGAGGQQGGASIPLVVIDTDIAPLAHAATLIPGPGGRGGAGGTGAVGGSGGRGASGFPATQIRFPTVGFSVTAPALGSKGGDGGPGGAGAGGAGGNGGPSMAIAAVGAVPDPGAFFRYPTLPGAAGQRGGGITNPTLAGNVNSLCRSTDGQDGLPGAGDAVIRFEGED